MKKTIQNIFLSPTIHQNRDGSTAENYLFVLPHSNGSPSLPVPVCVGHLLAAHTLQSAGGKENMKNMKNADLRIEFWINSKA